MKRTGPFRTRLTRRFYRVLYCLYRAIFSDEISPAPLPPARARRVLLARTDRVGDAVVLTPTIAYLRARLPAAEIDVVTASATSLLTHDPRIDHVYQYRRGLRGWWRMLHTLRARRYDVILTLRLRDHLDEGVTAALVAPPGAMRATVRRPPQYAGLFTHQFRVPLARRHVTTRFLHLAWAAVGDPHAAPPTPAEYPPRLTTTPVADARTGAFVAEVLAGRAFVAFNAWGSQRKRCFGVARAAEIAIALAVQHPDLAVVFTPPPARAAEAAAMAAGAIAALDPAAAERVVVAPPSADLTDLVALLSRAAIVLTPDTANMHIAAAVGTPLVAVYTAYTEAHLWGAWGAMPRRVVHFPEDCEIDAVPVQDIVDAVHDLLSGTRGDRGGRLLVTHTDAPRAAASASAPTPRPVPRQTPG